MLAKRLRHAIIGVSPSPLFSCLWGSARVGPQRHLSRRSCALHDADLRVDAQQKDTDHDDADVDLDYRRKQPSGQISAACSQNPSPVPMT